MRLTYLQYSLIVFSLAFTLCKPGYTQDGAIDSPQNVRIEGNLLVWDPVGNASGYNIYYNPEEAAADSLNDRPVYYLDTLKGVTEYMMPSAGTYLVVAFDENSDSYSSTVDAQRVYYDTNGANEPPDSMGGTLTAVSVVTNVCDNVVAGGTCRAICATELQVATGGACSTSDIVEADATATPISYSCTVPLFSGFVTAQVYCLNTAFFSQGHGIDTPVIPSRPIEEVLNRENADNVLRGLHSEILANLAGSSNSMQVELQQTGDQLCLTSSSQLAATWSSGNTVQVDTYDDGWNKGPICASLTGVADETGLRFDSGALTITSQGYELTVDITTDFPTNGYTLFYRRGGGSRSWRGEGACVSPESEPCNFLPPIY